jgi:hypothetical protein
MGLLDALVGRCFRDETVGRVVVFPNDRRKRGYRVKSKVEELKIAAFIKMFFIAHLSIFVFGYLLAYEWSRWLAYELGRPAAHPVRTAGIFLGIYSVVVGLPYLLLTRSYRKAIFSFVFAADEILVGAARPPKQRALTVGLLALGGLLLILAGSFLVWMTSAK